MRFFHSAYLSLASESNSPPQRSPDVKLATRKFATSSSEYVLATFLIENKSLRLANACLLALTFPR